MLVRFLPEPDGAPVLPAHAGPPIVTRRLTLADAAAFEAVVPSWALRGWDSAEVCLGRGAAVGVARGPTFLALAWVLEIDRYLDAIGVYTAPRYRRLGLGWAVSASLIGQIVTRRRKSPLWACAEDNEASLALSRAWGSVSSWPSPCSTSATAASTTTPARPPPRWRDGPSCQGFDRPCRRADRAPTGCFPLCARPR